MFDADYDTEGYCSDVCRYNVHCFLAWLSFAPTPGLLSNAHWSRIYRVYRTYLHFSQYFLVPHRSAISVVDCSNLI